MPIGPGKYDEEATLVRERTGAEGVAVLVFGGVRGSGFSVQGPLEMQVALPEILRDMAAGVERSLLEMDVNMGKRP